MKPQTSLHTPYWVHACLSPMNSQPTSHQGCSKLASPTLATAKPCSGVDALTPDVLRQDNCIELLTASSQHGCIPPAFIQIFGFLLAAGQNASGSALILVAPIPPSESSSIHLMAVTADGRLVYLSTQPTSGAPPGNGLRRPSCLNIVFNKRAIPAPASQGNSRCDPDCTRCPVRCKFTRLASCSQESWQQAARLTVAQPSMSSWGCQKEECKLKPVV